MTRVYIVGLLICVMLLQIQSFHFNRMPTFSKSKVSLNIVEYSIYGAQGTCIFYQLMMSGAGASDTFVPDMARRKTMNNILLGSVGLTTLSLAYPYFAFFVPPSTGGGSAGTTATDAAGKDITVEGWKASHQPSARELVQGLKGDATYLILDDQKNLADFGLNAVCTHLGCVVPWNKAENKFM